MPLRNLNSPIKSFITLFLCNYNAYLIKPGPIAFHPAF
ncbi:hypothetical protein CPter91_4554 [Collimonas pratensis]|uniref:Uncharacterized protein n=1 Tax=Collimonas pratensis TaxID=279113 RepID=A0A127Q9W3_9BURK|nr:hypothetical protein CPter91_4554 [Collimonas pratensis]